MATLNTSNGQLEFKIGNKTEFYQFSKLSNVTWVLNNDGNYYIQLTYENDYFVKIQLIDITNQPSWTNDLAGAEQAVKDISTWIGLITLPTPGLATEATLLNVLTAVDNMRDYEVRLVVDSTPVTPVTWLEVRYWDAQSGTLGTPQYYLPGSTTPGSPVLPISYINDQTLLSQMLAELQAQTPILTDIETNTNNVATETTLQSVAISANNIDNSTISIDNEVQALNIKLTSVVRTPAFLRPTGVNGSVSAGAFSMSFASVGTANAIVGGIILKPGETLNFDAGALNNTLGAVAYDTLTNAGAELIIITLT